jgi:glycosyltransferase involved in cell wall biosynthesis
MPATEKAHGILVLSHLRWNFVWQRPQQFLSRFAEQHPVLFVELTDFSLPSGYEPYLELTSPQKNVWVANIRIPGDLAGQPIIDELMRKHTREAMEKLNAETDNAFENPLMWVYSPMDSHWALGHINVRGVAYDCMDELSQFAGADPQLVHREARLIEQSDIIFTGGYELWTKKSQQHKNVHFFGCGVEYDHFSQAQDASQPIPEDVKDLKRPIVGWFGVVDERVDYDLIRELVKIRPDYSFVFVGPVVKVDPNSLPQAENLHWLGGRDYKVLPDYCRAYDVCMMPFALNEATQYINPTKALEYLATGKPVVSTPVADVVRQYTDTVQIARTAEEFAACIDRALNSPDAEMIQRGVEKAREAGWECTVQKMQDLIREAVKAEPPTTYLS